MPPTTNRHVWIDLLRGIAVLGMVWTHSANTFLDAALVNTPGYQNLSFYHGLVAPTFFWVAGFMRGMAASRTGPKRPAWPTVKRLLVIWAIGHLMHMPWGQFAQGDFSASAWKLLLQCDVLQCLAISSLILFGVERVTPNLWVRRALVLCIGLGAVLATDALVNVETGLLPLDACLNHSTGSRFPLFPWFGFAAAGFLLGSWGPPTWKAGLCAALAVAGFYWLPGAYSTFTFFLVRLAWVTAIAAAVRWIPTDGRWCAPLLLAGRESLMLYVAHLMMIHALPLWHGSSLDHAIGNTQPPVKVAALFLALVLGSLLLAWLNEYRKSRHTT